MATKLIEERKPTLQESRHQVERVFIREDEKGRKITIYASRCYESWEQWGAHTEALSDNVPAVEAWRRTFDK